MSTSFIEIRTEGFSDILNITDQINQEIMKSNIAQGICLVSVPGSTASITTLEFESGAVQDLKNALEHIAPQDGCYIHNEKWGDGNGFSHIRSALLGPSLSLPFSGGLLNIGTWQQLILIDHDNRSRNRRIMVYLLGDR